MKTTTLFLILSLMIPLQSALSADCKPGQYFDTTLNRCLMTIDNAEVRLNASACDGKTGDALKECFINNASSQRSSLEEEGLETIDKDFKKGSGMKIAVPMAVTLLTSYYLFINKDKFKDCKSTSIWLLFGAGVSSFVGEISAQITYKKKTKDLEKKYKDKMSEYENDETKYAAINNNQEIAFDYMEAQETARLTAEKVRFGTYTLATTLYAGAAVAAAAEALSKNGGTCIKTPDKTTTSLNMGFDFMQVVDKDFGEYHYIKDITYTEFIEIAVRKVANIIVPSAHAQDTPVQDLPVPPEGSQELYTGGWITPKTDNAGNTTYEAYDINGNLQGPYNGTDFTNIDGDKVTLTDKGFDVGANLLGEVVITACRDSEKKYNEETKKCEVPTVVTEAKEILGGFDKSEAGKKHLNILDKAMRSAIFRGGLAVAVGAYTFTLAKQAKENIEILKKRIAAIQKLKSDFVDNGGTSGMELCNMTEEQENEPARCKGIRANSSNSKTTRDWNLLAGIGSGPIKTCIGKNNKIDNSCECKKNNTCARIPSGFSIGGLGNSSWANAIAMPANKLLTGKFSGADLDTADLNNKSYALKAKLKKMTKDPKFSDIAKKINSTGRNIQNSNLRLFKKSFPNGAPPSLAAFGAGVSNSIPTTASDVVKSVQEKISASKKTKFTEGGTLAGQGKADNGLDFDWGSSTGNGAGVKIDDVASVMDKNYKITGDINKNSTQDIFKILSIRYQRSGLRRLFDESGKSSSDEANSSDINEK